MSGDPPPPLPRVFFGRDELIDKIIGLARQLTPIALIGAGGIGKTSIILTALHDGRIKRRFGQDRRFIRCDEFPASSAHFLRRLSSAIGAGIENPENLSSLRPFLSSKEMFIVLDNAESILDPEGSSAQEIYAMVDELTRFSNICLCITSRISIIPPDCKIFKVPTLSTEAGQDAFYRIYGDDKRPNSINGILEQLDNHPLSITLLATVAQHNQWDANRLVEEWDKQRTGVLCAQHFQSLATAIDLSLASPTFQELGPDARPLLEVVAFLPQGVNEKNTNWLFPAISSVQNILDKFCVLSLAYRNDGFITMLAPLRDHLRPKDPSSSPLLNMTKENYFLQLSADKPGSKRAQWITTEDVNVEHLLDVFTAIDPNSESTWDACAKFTAQLYWHKPRLVTLGLKIEALSNDHPSKVKCLRALIRLYNSVGNVVEHKRLLSHFLKHWREQGNDFEVARTLRSLADTNRRMGLFAEGILQVKEASKIFERLGFVVRQAGTLVTLAYVLYGDGQFNAAKEASSHAIDLLPEKGEELWVCKAHRVLGEVYQSKGKMKKAIRHLEKALEIASSLNMVKQLLWVNFTLVEVFTAERKFGDAQTHIERAKSLAANNTYDLAYVMYQQARVWNGQHKIEEARSEALRALNVFEELRDALSAETVRDLLQQIEARQSDHPWRFKWRW